MDVWLSLFVVTASFSDSPKAMSFIEALCPSVAFERPEFKGFRVFDFRLFNKCGAKSVIGPSWVDVQLFDPVSV